MRATGANAYAPAAPYIALVMTRSTRSSSAARTNPLARWTGANYVYAAPASYIMKTISQADISASTRLMSAAKNR